MALSHPITIFAPQKYYFFPQPPTNPQKYSKTKKKKAPKSIEKSLNSSAKIGSVILLGFEPKTHSLEGCCSIQLSYRTILHLPDKRAKKCGEKGIRTPGGS